MKKLENKLSFSELAKLQARFKRQEQICIQRGYHNYQEYPNQTIICRDCNLTHHFYLPKN